MYFYNGSKYFIIAMAQMYKQRGMKISRDGVTKKEGEKAE